MSVAEVMRDTEDYLTSVLKILVLEQGHCLQVNSREPPCRAKQMIHCTLCTFNNAIVLSMTEMRRLILVPCH